MPKQGFGRKVSVFFFLFSSSSSLVFVVSLSLSLLAEIGDYDDVADREYLKLTKLLPHQEELQEKIMEFHRRHV